MAPCLCSSPPAVSFPCSGVVSDWRHLFSSLACCERPPAFHVRSVGLPARLWLRLTGMWQVRSNSACLEHPLSSFQPAPSHGSASVRSRAEISCSDGQVPGWRSCHGSASCLRFLSSFGGMRFLQTAFCIGTDFVARRIHIITKAEACRPWIAMCRSMLFSRNGRRPKQLYASETNVLEASIRGGNHPCYTLGHLLQ